MDVHKTNLCMHAACDDNNVAAQNELALLSGPPEPVVEVKAVQELPEIAVEISGETYQLETNPWKYNDFQLVFDPAWDYAEFNYSAKQGEVINMHVGLDNVYRMAESNGKTYAAVGYWSTPDTFTLDYELVGYSTQDKWILTFHDDEIAVQEIGVTGAYTYKGKI